MTTAHRADYRWLAQVYESVQPTGTSDALLWQRLGAKTLELVHGHITEVRVTSTGLDEVIVDAETIEAIRQLGLPDGTVTLPEANEPITWQKPSTPSMRASGVGSNLPETIRCTSLFRSALSGYAPAR